MQKNHFSFGNDNNPWQTSNNIAYASYSPNQNNTLNPQLQKSHFNLGNSSKLYGETTYMIDYTKKPLNYGDYDCWC